LRFHWSTKSVVHVAPYEKLAAIYDHVMRHVDYRQWAEYVVHLIGLWHPEARDILDVSCGTGNLLVHLRQYPYRLYGCDASFPMIRKAVQKAELEGCPLWCGDMTRIGLRRSVDVLLCLYDSVNYLLEEEDLRRFLAEAHAAIAPDGLLIFDVCTEHNSLEFFYNYYDHEKHETFWYDRWSHYDRRERIQFTEFKIRFRDDPNVYLEVHRQRIYPVPRFLKLIEESPLELMATYHMFTTQPATARSNRIHFVLKKPQ